jgi:CBS-domain-containing membrane protein
MLLEEAATIPVTQILSAPAITLPVGMTIGDALRLLRTMAIKRLPIVDQNQRLVGMLTRSDILRNLLFANPSLLAGQTGNTEPPPVNILPIEPALTTQVGTPLSLLLQKMRTALLRHAVVINAKGNPIGVISESDLLTRTTADQLTVIQTILDGEEAIAHQVDDAALDALSAGDLMTTPVITVQTHDTTQTAMRLLIENQLKRLPVVDDTGHVVGLLDRRTLLYGLLDNELNSAEEQ